MAQEDFKLYIRREPGELRVTVRFEVSEGHGILALQGKGKAKEMAPQLTFEESGVPHQDLRGGRFIHVLPSSGRRQSYALSRLAEDLLGRVSDDKWTKLQPITEFGFRYLVVPEEALVAGSPGGGKAAVSVGAGSGGSPAAAAAAGPARKGKGKAASLLAKARSNSTARANGAPAGAGGSEGGPLQRAMANLKANASPGGAPAPSKGGDAASLLAKARSARAAAQKSSSSAGKLPERPQQVAPALAQGALDKLSRDEALELLRGEMDKVGQLHLALEAARRELADSRARERDLLEVLAKWQDRAGGG